MRGLAALLAGALRTSIGVIPGMRCSTASPGWCSASSPESSCAGRSAPSSSTCRARPTCVAPCSARRSSSEINDVFPPERLLEELERVDPIGVFLGPPAIVAPPDKGLAKDPDVVRASKSVVRVTGIACGLGVEGSGWVASPRPGRDERARRRGHPTAAGRHVRRHGVHVDGRRVRRDERPRRAPRARARRRPLALAPPDAEHAVALVGYPQNGPLTRTAGTARRHGRRPQPRRVRPRAGHDARSPRSAARSSPGAPADRASTRRARVRTTVFARRPRETGGYGIPADLVQEGARAGGLAAGRRPTARASTRLARSGSSRRGRAPRAADGTAG